MDIKGEVLRKIKPSHEEIERVKHFVSDLQTVAKTVSGLDAMIVGSIGKFTWLKGDHDVDIFLMFDQTVPREELERLGMEYGKRIVDELGGRCMIKYAEHPYVHAVVRGFDIDVVPCYRIGHGEKIKSAVDRSPLHLRYVLDYLKPAMADDVRLLKQFCKGIGVYGSDAKHQGFSGYICELLVLHYGSFDRVIDATRSWRAPFTINIERHLGISMVKFRDQPLVIIDPVDPERNVSAVISGENFVRFVSSCKAYHAKPSTGFFFPKAPKPLSRNQAALLKRRGTGFLAVAFPRPDVIDDVLYPQLRRALQRVENLLHQNDFRILRSFEFAEKGCALVFELEVSELPRARKTVGPPIFEDKHSEEFLAKYSKEFVYVSDNKWVADIPRKYLSAAQILSEFLRSGSDKLAEGGIPAHVASSMPKAKILSGESFWAFQARNKALSARLNDRYFSNYAKDFMK